MPRLSLSQRLTDPEGLPTVAAIVALLSLMLVAAAASFAVASRGGQAENPDRTVSVSRVAGDLTMATPERRPALGAAAALPRLQGRRRGPGAVRLDRAATPPVPSATPAPAVVPESTATPEPTTVPAPVAAPQEPQEPPAQVPAATPRPRSTPAPTFDTSG